MKVDWIIMESIISLRDILDLLNDVVRCKYSLYWDMRGFVQKY